MTYPARPVRDVLPQFRGTATVRQSPTQRAELLSFVRHQYVDEGRSLREIAELTGRTQSAVRRALDQAGVQRRAAGAAPLSSQGQLEA